MVGFTKIEENADKVDCKIKELGITDVKILKLNELKYFLAKENSEEWLSTEKELLQSWFKKVRDLNSKDLLIPRIVWVECVGLPIIAWKEENLKAYMNNLGEWICWEFEDKVGRRIFNPRICISTINMKEINTEMTILVRGVQYDIRLKELKDIGMNMGFQNSFDNNHQLFDDGEDPYPDNDEEQDFDKNTRRMHPIYKSSEEGDVKSDSNESITKGGPMLSGNRVMEDETEISRIPESEEVDESSKQDIIQSEIMERIINGNSIDLTSNVQEIEVIEKYPINNLAWRSKNCSLSNSVNSIDIVVTKLGGLSSKSNDDNLNGIGSEEGVICNILEKMSMGLKRGRPKNESKSFINPFDIGLKKKVANKGRKSFKVTKNRKLRSRDNLEIVSMGNKRSKQGDLRAQALEIADSAYLMGLKFF